MKDRFGLSWQVVPTDMNDIANRAAAGKLERATAGIRWQRKTCGRHVRVGVRRAYRQTMPLKSGDKAPAFNLVDQHGDKVRLSSFKGTKVLVYFYPKADTPGCTQQACG